MIAVKITTGDERCVLGPVDVVVSQAVLPRGARLRGLQHIRESCFETPVAHYASNWAREQLNTAKERTNDENYNPPL